MLKERESSDGSPSAPDVCAGCGGRIQDRFYLLAIDRQWHGTCLRCCECRMPLDTELSCFSRDGNIYCKEDYYKLFCAKRCARCGHGISSTALVMRAKDLVYHLTCFSCVACGNLLSKGDMFGMKEGMVFCQRHYENICPDYTDDESIMNNVYRCQDNSGGDSPSEYFSQGPKGRPRKRKTQGSPEDMQVQAMRMASTGLEIVHRGDLSSSMESLAYDSSVASPGSISSNSQRTKRMRTSFKHHQLRTMKSYFAINQNPDAKDLKQLAQKTGLSKRVLQVWFQNARAKWRRNIMRQESNGAPGNGIVPGSMTPIVQGMMIPDTLQSLDEMSVVPHQPIVSFTEIY